MGADLKLVTLYDSNLRDPIVCLRNIADRLEAGDYGVCQTLAVAIFADKLFVFGGGPDSEGPTVHYLFSSAANLMQQGLTEYGRIR